MSEHEVVRMYFDGIQKYCAKHSPCSRGKCVFYDTLSEKCLINYPFGGEQMKMPKIDYNLKRMQG